MDTIKYEKKDNVGWIILNRPEVLNAQNSLLLSELTFVLQSASEDNDVHIIVITGTGDKAFSAGGDIEEFANLDPLDYLRMHKGTKRPYELVREIPKPIIAMVNGFALGGGCELAMGCDIIIASDNARFGQPEITVGVIPGGGGTQVLPRLIGEKKAKELIFTGGVISAQDALMMGLVNQVVPKEKLLDAVMALIDKLKAKSPAVLSLAKLAVNRSQETPLSIGMECETEYFSLCLATQDQKEGAKAFIEKRKPVYVGK